MVYGRIVLACLLIAGAGTDLAWRRIPNAIVCAGLAVFATVAAQLLFNGQVAVFVGCLCAGTLAFAIHFVPWLLRKMGAGDVKMALLIGLLTGWQDWSGFISMYCVVLLVASCALLAMRKKKLDTLPLAPFMAAAWFLYYLSEAVNV